MPDTSPAIIRQFLAQSGSLFDRLDGDLAELQRSPHDAGAADRLSGALAAIRTGAGLLDLAEFEHAAARAAAALHTLRHAGESEAALRSLSDAIRAVTHQRTTIERSLPASSPAQPTPTPTVERRPLRLDGSKTELVEFMVEDLRDTIAKAERAADRMESPAGLEAGASELARIGGDLSRTARFFEFDGMVGLADAITDISAAAPRMNPTTRAQALPRVRAVLELVRELADALAYSTIIVRPVAGVCNALRMLACGGSLDLAQLLPSDCTPLLALEIDGVIAPERAAAPPQPEPIAAEPIPAPTPAPVEFEAISPMVPLPEPMIDEQAAVFATAVETCTIQASDDAPVADTMACLPVAMDCASRLDDALNEVGALVVQANRLAAMPFQSSALESNASVLARVGTLTDEVARATSSIRHAVQTARALPISMLFDRCMDAASLPRECVEYVGAELNVDSGVIDRLVAPMAAIVGACDGPSRVRLSACHDDATDILELTINAGGAPDAIAAAVGAARSPIESMRGTVAIEQDDAGRATIRVRVPANPVFLHCTLVRIGRTHVAFPIDRVQEVIRPEIDQRTGTPSMPVVMVRSGAAALLDGAATFGDDTREDHPYAVVVEHAGKRVAVSCSRPVATQEIVVRPMDPMPARGGPISGVGAMLDGSPTLIVDIPALVRLAGDVRETRSIAA